MAGETLAVRWRLVRGSNIQPSLRLTLYALHCFQGNGSAAFCSRESLADEVGVHVDRLSGKLKALEDLGLIERIWTQRNGRPSREFSINYETLKKHSRSALTNSSECTLTESSEGKSSTLTNSSVAPCECRQSHPDEFVRPLYIEHPEKIQGRSKRAALPPALLSLSSAKKERAPVSTEELTAFCVVWNSWHSAGIVRQEIRATDVPGTTLLSSWKRAQRDPEQRERLADLPGLRAAITSSQRFLNSAAWFDAAGLIGGKNKNHRWYAEQLVAGVYRDQAGTNGVASNPEAEKAWKVLLASLKKHSRYKPDQIEADVGERAWRALNPIKLRDIDEADEFKLRELHKEFIQQFTSQGAAA